MTLQVNSRQMEREPQSEYARLEEIQIYLVLLLRFQTRLGLRSTTI
jgi:hypothetical protein